MPPANYEITVQSDYVVIERPEDYEVVAENVPTMLADLSAACAKAGCHKALIVGPRTKVHLDTSDLYNLGQAIAKLRLQIAMVEMHDVSADDVDFLETVVFNRGSPLRFFANVEDAKEWLDVS